MASKFSKVERARLWTWGLLVGGAALREAWSQWWGKESRYPPKIWMHAPPRAISGLVSDEADDYESPPPGLEYDDRPPCQLPKRPKPGPPQSAPGPDAAGEDEGFCVPPADLEPAPQTEVAFAAGSNRPGWPLATDEERKIVVSYKDVRGKFHGHWGRHFGTARPKSGRIHVGVDLGADEGDLIVAMEDGVVEAILPFLCRRKDETKPCIGDNILERTYGVYVRTASGLLVNYGEVQEGSWQKFGFSQGVDLGQPVIAGQPLARVSGTQMLHLETMRPETTIAQIRREELQWHRQDRAPPPEILDPTRYLVRARKVKYDQLMEKEAD